MLSYLNGTLSRSAVSSEVLQEIRRDIILQNYLPGTNLTEQSICEKYNISKSPTRQILQQLKNEGFVNMLDNGCKQIVEFTRNDLYCLYSHRDYLEITAVKTIIKQKVKSYSHILEALIKIENTPLISQATYFEQDIDFHHSIIEMADNKYILASYENIAPILYTMFLISYKEVEFSPSFPENHNLLIKALINENEEECLREFSNHHGSSIRNAEAALDALVWSKKKK